MKKLFNKLSIAASATKKTFTALLAVAVVLGIAGSAGAWFPERPTYTIERPADHVTFNSITNNPNEGDERAFFEVKDATHTQTDGFSHTMNGVKDGQELLMRVYVHNNAADHLNGPNFTGPGVAKNTKVRISLPTATADAMRANAYISADNAQPREVSDTLDLNGNSAFKVSYIPGSAVQYTNAKPNGIKLNDSIVTAAGAPIGHNQADGVVPGCFKYDSIVTIKVKVHVPKTGLTITKEVAHPGQPWAENVVAKGGDTISYLLTVKNVGNTVAENVSVRDQLPAHQHIVPGSTTITNGNNPNGINAGSDAVVTSGINIGKYNPGAVAYVKFKVTIDPVEKLECGKKQLVNKATVFRPGNNTTESDTASVTVNKECKPVTPTTPVTPETPTQLPETGAGEVIGIFIATTVAGAIAHRLILARRYS